MSPTGEPVGIGVDVDDGWIQEATSESQHPEVMAIQHAVEEDAALLGSPSASKKRKQPERNPDSSPRLGGSKKVKLAEDLAREPSHFPVGGDKSLLPAEIWHSIFTFCPPKSLGNLLRVNKLFNLYLDSSSTVRRDPVSVKPGALVVLEPSAIWRASRRLFWPQMPAPLRSRAEIDMWRLACTPKCQNCGRTDDRDRSSPSDAIRPGPGLNGVAIIWPFATRACASCLLKASVKVS